LKDALPVSKKSIVAVKIPSDLPAVLEKLKSAFIDTDFIAIDQGTKSLEAIAADGALKDRIGQILDSVTIMDYEEATELIDNLLGGS
jgi:hypothetical protein